MKKLILLAVILGASASHGQRAFPIHGGRLTSDLDAGGHSITNLAPGFAGSIGALTNAALFATPEDVADATNGLLSAESDPVALPVAEAAYHAATNITAASLGALTEESDPVALPLAASALVHATNALPRAGGSMTGPLVLDGASGLTFCGVGLSTNFLVRVEHDGTNWNWNVYEVAR